MAKRKKETAPEIGNSSFFEALAVLGEENSVETELLIEKIKSAMLKAARKAYPHSEDNIRVEIDPAAKKFEMYIDQEIIDDEPIDDNEINIDVAKTIDPNAYVGGRILKRIDISKFGRMAALSAKQSIKGDLREINRDQMLARFESKEHECITAKISQVEPGRGTATVIYDGTELYLFRNEQIPNEELKEGKSIKVYITGITNKNKKPIVKISRTHKDLVKRLFEIEVPEIYDGTIEVKSISREAGSRTKIAVWSKNANVDAVGACIGARRSRISAVMNELNGEKIDIIPYSESPEEFIARALAPAPVIKAVITSFEEKTCTVIVPNEELSLAIGNKGQNAKLAAKLTGFKIDIKPQFDALTGDEAPELSPDFAVPEKPPVADEDAFAEAEKMIAAEDANEIETDTETDSETEAATETITEETAAAADDETSSEEIASENEHEA